GLYGARGTDVKIGLLDTGVDAEHPDLKGKVAGWAEFDSRGNLLPNSVAHDTGKHGTHCAGTLVGGNASGRFIGMAPDATLAVGMVIDSEKGGSDAQVLAGIDWAVEQGVDVISMSLGGLVMDPETPPTYTEAILTCHEAGIPVIIAIGNEGEQTTGSPGNDLFALSVGATDIRDRVAGFSGGRTQIILRSDYIDASYLPLPYSKPDISAPGVAVYSSVPDGKWGAMNGTSMATPHVAGAIALLLSATDIRAKMTGAQRAYLVQDLICGSVDDLGESGQDHRYGFGCLNVLRAIDFAIKRDY
ncbi:S8 family serine peptidase, partial [bacterium]|nr:S8 family serine peptidase [bacterium]